MKNWILVLALLFPFCVNAQSEWVNPMIGTDGTGHTFPAALVPFGMVQVGPDTRIDGSWEGCSGYHYADSVIYGFSHTHLSGTGCSDYGDILLMPFTGEVPATPSPAFYRSSFSHANEKAEAGYYSVTLNRGNIRCEMAPTARSALHRYSLPDAKKTETLYLVLDLSHRDQLLDWKITQMSAYGVTGYRRSKAWARDQKVYYYIEFDRPFVSVVSPTPSCRVYAFAVRPGEPLQVKVGISAVDEEGAEQNVKTEIPGFDFAAVRQNAKKMWNTELSKITVKGGTPADRTNFYTALYHSFIHPSLFSDADGRYLGRDGKIHRTDRAYYTVFSLWDTFRAQHPLQTIINRRRATDFVETLLLEYAQGGRLPMWELWGNETDCMIGYHAVSLLADAHAKGLPMDVSLAFEAAKANATYSERGVPLYATKGYLETGDEGESVAKTLEYAYDDWCVARLAQAAGKPEEAKVFLKRARSWINLLDPETGLMRPRNNGNRITPFDPKEVNNHYTEANAWQYSFFVPHDIYGLRDALGGNVAFEQLLDRLFSTSEATTGRIQPDITGLIGQYAHGNEPSHHMAYLYTYLNRPEKTARYVHRILTELYKPTPDGLPGNEDCGQMSAWYVFSALGFYPVTPGLDQYVIGFPIFQESSILLENGKKFTVKAKGNVPGNYHIRSVILNGKPLRRLWITHAEIEAGGTLQLEFGPDSSARVDGWEEFPGPWFTPGVAAPEIRAAGLPFKQSLDISLLAFRADESLFYTVDGSDPRQGKRYTQPFRITDSTRIRAVSQNASGAWSDEAEAFYRPFRNPEQQVKLLSRYDPQYSAGGPEGLIDGVRGKADWRRGNWQGYQDTDFIAEIDLGKTRNINGIHIGFMQDFRSWILLPRSVTLEWFDADRQLLKRSETELPLRDRDESVFLYPWQHTEPVSGARYVRIRALNYGALPAWNPGAGSPAFIFVDEVRVE